MDKVGKKVENATDMATEAKEAATKASTEVEDVRKEVKQLRGELEEVERVEFQNTVKKVLGQKLSRVSRNTGTEGGQTEEEGELRLKVGGTTRWFSQVSHGTCRIRR